MKGHIFRRGKNWAIVYDGERHENGDRNQIWVTVHGTKRDAEQELVRILHEQQSGTDLEPSTVTVARYLERWLADGAAPSVTPKTLERYSEIVRLHLVPALGHHRLAKLRPLHIQGYYGQALESGRRDGKGGLSPRTVLHHHRVLHRALSRAVKWRLLAVNPADAVEPPRATSPEMQTLTEEEIGQLLTAAVATPSYMAILLAVTTGVRRGELLALRWADTDFEQGRISVRRSLQQTNAGLTFKPPKTAKGNRTIPLPALALEALRSHRVEQAKHRLLMGDRYVNGDLIFAKTDGTPLDPDGFSASFGAIVRRSGLKRVRLHDLRHTHATLLLRQNVHPKVVQERLGHSSIAVTLDTYSHVGPNLQEQATQALDALLRDHVPPTAVVTSTD